MELSCWSWCYSTRYFTWININSTGQKRNLAGILEELMQSVETLLHHTQMAGSESAHRMNSKEDNLSSRRSTEDTLQFSEEKITCLMLCMLTALIWEQILDSVEKSSGTAALNVLSMDGLSMVNLEHAWIPLTLMLRTALIMSTMILKIWQKEKTAITLRHAQVDHLRRFKSSKYARETIWFTFGSMHSTKLLTMNHSRLMMSSMSKQEAKA